MENWSIYFFISAINFLLKYSTVQKRTQILAYNSVTFHKVDTLVKPAPRSCTGIFLTFQKPPVAPFGH